MFPFEIVDLIREYQGLDGLVGWMFVNKRFFSQVPINTKKNKTKKDVYDTIYRSIFFGSKKGSELARFTSQQPFDLSFVSGEKGVYTVKCFYYINTKIVNYLRLWKSIPKDRGSVIEFTKLFNSYIYSLEYTRAENQECKSIYLEIERILIPNLSPSDFWVLDSNHLVSPLHEIQSINPCLVNSIAFMEKRKGVLRILNYYSQNTCFSEETISRFNSKYKGLIIEFGYETSKISNRFLEFDSIKLLSELKLNVDCTVICTKWTGNLQLYTNQYYLAMMCEVMGWRWC